MTGKEIYRRTAYKLSFLSRKSMAAICKWETMISTFPTDVCFFSQNTVWIFLVAFDDYIAQFLMIVSHSFLMIISHSFLEYKSFFV